MAVTNDLSAADFEKFSYDLFLQNLFRLQFEENEETSQPIVDNEMAKIYAHLLSGWGQA
jgi:hypothetical protein